MTRAISCFSFGFQRALLLAWFTATDRCESHCSDIGGASSRVGGFGQIDGSVTTMGVATGDLKERRVRF